MKRRCLSILLVLALCLAYLPVPVHAEDVSNFAGFTDAVGSAGDGGTIVIDVDNYEAEIDMAGVGDPDASYTIDLAGHNFSVRAGDTFLSASNWTIIDSVGGGSFTAGDITLTGGADDAVDFIVNGDSGAFSFTASGTIGTDAESAYIRFVNGITVDIGTIETAELSPVIVFGENGVTGSVSAIRLTGTGGGQRVVRIINSVLTIGEIYIPDGSVLSMVNKTLEITGSDGTNITAIDIGGDTAQMTVGGELECGSVIWSSNNPIELGEAVFTIGLADLSSPAEANEPFQFNDSTSKVEILIGGGNGVQSAGSADWLYAYLQSTPYLPDHVTVTNSGGAIDLAESDNIDGSARAINKIVLSPGTGTAHFSGLDPGDTDSLQSVFVTKEYNGAEQALFPEESAAETGGTVWYCLDTAAGTPVWTTTAPSATDVVEYPNASYWIAGDAEHNDSIQVLCPAGSAAGIHAMPLTVKMNSDTVVYDGTSHTAEGFTVTSGTLPTGFAIDGTASGTGTDAGVYPNTFASGPVVRDGSDNNVSTNFDITTESGSLTIEPRPVEVVADDQNVLTGDPMPALTAQVIGAVDGEEDLIAYTVSTAAADTNTEGTYPITPAGDATQGNYAVTYTDGLLTVGALPPAAWTAEPAAVDGLIYSGTAQELVTAGTVPAGCTALYSMDGVTYDTAIPAGTDAGSYTVYYKVRGDGVNYWDSAAGGPLNVTIAAKEVTVTADDKTKTYGEDDPELTAAVSGLIGTDTVAYTLSRETGEEVGEYIITPTGDEEQGNYRVTGFYPGTLTIGSRSSGSPAPKQETYDFEQPEEGVGSGVEEEDAWTWGERANLPEDVATLYQVLANNAVSEEEEAPLPYPGLGSEHFLASDDVWTLPPEDRPGRSYQVVNVMVCEDHEPLYFANGDGKLDENSFGRSDFYVVNAGSGDSKIDYPNLTIGDVVRTKTFNGVFVTKLQKSNNPAFDADLDRLKSDTFASFRAFELDHPEVFWLTGDIKIRSMTVTVNGVQTAYLFLVLADDTGFTMRISDYSAPGAIEAAIARRDAAVAEIIAQIPAGASVREKIANLNKWFTLHNEYNRSADLNSIGFTPHRSLKSLVGSEGVDGPVCDGYSRGFKTVCDRLGIPVILDTGVASRGSHSEYHMWMRVQVDGVWYGMDCTWNDPVMEGVNGKISGYENEQYMLVGDDTVVDGQKFGVSHPVNKTAGGTTGVLFASLMVNAGEIDGYLPLDFEDVRLADWFYDFVKSAANKGLMGGVADRVFSPQTTATRGQIVQILYNAAGQPAVSEVKVGGWFGKAASWAMEKGIVAGYPDGGFHGNDPVTREQLATILWAYEGAPAQEGTPDFADSGEISAYAVDALLWAQTGGIIGGKPGNLADPQGTATRAEIATIFSNYLK